MNPALFGADVVGPPLPFAPFRTAFCIPGALPGDPWGDGKIWTPALGCFPLEKQNAWCDALLLRQYGWCVYQLSGLPYRGDYPPLALDIDRIVRDLKLLRRRTLRSIIAFDDQRVPDLSYLAPVAAATQHLVDATLGVFELNGVNGIDWDETKTASVLQQQHNLWPNAICGFHSTTQDNGGKGFGELSFWQEVAPYVDVYFLQQSAWSHTLDDTANRAHDFAQRLIGGADGWPVLRKGVVLAEETTSMTYRSWNEAQGMHVTDWLMHAITPRPSGYLDSGSIEP